MKGGDTLKKFKIRLTVISVIAIVLSLFMQETVAYYSTIGKASNVVTSGNLKMMIHEKTDQGTDFPAEGVYIMPGDIVSKQVSVENICEHPFYLRVRVVYGVNSQELSAADCFKLNINEDNWQREGNWYYYKNVLQPGETTPLVFSHVEIVGSSVNNSYIGKTLMLTVDAQAVQSENNPVSGHAVYQALGWPEE